MTSFCGVEGKRGCIPTNTSLKSLGKTATRLWPRLWEPAPLTRIVFFSFVAGILMLCLMEEPLVPFMFRLNS